MYSPDSDICAKPLDALSHPGASAEGSMTGVAEKKGRRPGSAARLLLLLALLLPFAPATASAQQSDPAAATP